VLAGIEADTKAEITEDAAGESAEYQDFGIRL
jgi:hypothetical protein